MNKFVSKAKEELVELIPPTVFFFITLHLVALLRSLMLSGSGIPIASSVKVTVAALVLGKAVLIADALPLVNRYPNRPLAYNVAWKTVIYAIVATLLHYLENLYDFWKGSGGLVVANQKLLAAMIWPHFWAIHLFLVVIIFMYCTIRELIRVLGREKMREMFFGPPRNARPA